MHRLFSKGETINKGRLREQGHGSVIRSHTQDCPCDQLTGQGGVCNIISKQQVVDIDCNIGTESHLHKSEEGTFKVVPCGKGVFAGDTLNSCRCTCNNKLIRGMMNNVASTNDWWIGD